MGTCLEAPTFLSTYLLILLHPLSRIMSSLGYQVVLRVMNPSQECFYARRFLTFTAAKRSIQTAAHLNNHIPLLGTVEVGKRYGTWCYQESNPVLMIESQAWSKLTTRPPNLLPAKWIAFFARNRTSTYCGKGP